MVNIFIGYIVIFLMCLIGLPYIFITELIAYINKLWS